MPVVAEMHRLSDLLIYYWTSTSSDHKETATTTVQQLEQYIFVRPNFYPELAKCKSVKPLEQHTVI